MILAMGIIPYVVFLGPVRNYIFMFSQTTSKYSDEMNVLQNNINCTRKISNKDLIRSVACFVFIGITNLHCLYEKKMLVMISFKFISKLFN